MIQWVKSFRKASGETKFFIFNWFIYGLMIVATTVYCYLRLDYVRSYKTKPDSQTELSSN